MAKWLIVAVLWAFTCPQAIAQFSFSNPDWCPLPGKTCGPSGCYPSYSASGSNYGNNFGPKQRDPVAEKSARLDRAEQLYQLKKREDDLRARGVLPPRQKPSFTFEGVKYPSFEAFKQTPAYWEFEGASIWRELTKETVEIFAEQRKREAIQFEVNRRLNTPPRQFLLDQKKQTTARARAAMGESWWQANIGR